MFNGKIHYKWAIFNCYVSSPEGTFKTYQSCISSSQSLDLHIPVVFLLPWFPPHFFTMVPCYGPVVSRIHPSRLLSIFTTWVYKGVNFFLNIWLHMAVYFVHFVHPRCNPQKMCGSIGFDPPLYFCCPISSTQLLPVLTGFIPP